MPVEFGQVAPPRHVDAGTHPALGSFGPLIGLLHGCAGERRPLLGRPRLVVFAGDHGIATLGVSAHPVTETVRRITDLAVGAGRVAAIAADAGIGVRAVDIAVDADLTGLADVSVKVRRSSGRIDVEDALSSDELNAALEAGRTIADAEVDEGADLLIGSLCGVGVSTPVAVLVAGLTGMEPVDTTTRGSGINDAAWIRKAGAVRDALYRTRLAGVDAITLLRSAGGADLAALTGFIAQAAIRGTPVLIDDVGATVAALLAHRLAPGADAYVVATSLAPDRTHRRLLDLLGRDPLTAWSLRLGEGSGAALLVPVIRALARSLDDTDATTESVRNADSIDGWDPDLL